MEIKPVLISKIKSYLTILGLVPNSQKGDCEHWIGEYKEATGKSVIICVSEEKMPVIAIIAMLKELNEDLNDFLRIISLL